MATKANQLSASESLRLLVEGNSRFVQGFRSIDRTPNVHKVRELAQKGQQPLAAILTCSDSRLPTEMLFDRGLGELFVVRTAGNIIAPSLIASLEFSVLSFGTPLVVVMGHTVCGAVKTAIECDAGNVASLGSPHLEKLVSKVLPAVRRVRARAVKELEREELVRQATIENVRRSVELLQKKSAVMREKSEKSKVMIVGAVCDLHTGHVQFDLTQSQLKTLGAYDEVVAESV